MITTFYIHDVVVLRAPLEADKYNPSGASFRDWAHATHAWTGKGWLAPKGSQSENLNDREQDLNYSWLYLPPTANPLATDRVTINGTMYQVYSAAVTAYTPRGLHHYEVRVKEIHG